MPPGSRCHQVVKFWSPRGKKTRQHALGYGMLNILFAVIVHGFEEGRRPSGPAPRPNATTPSPSFLI